MSTKLRRTLVICGLLLASCSGLNSVQDIVSSGAGFQSEIHAVTQFAARIHYRTRTGNFYHRASRSSR